MSTAVAQRENAQVLLRQELSLIIEQVDGIQSLILRNSAEWEEKVLPYSGGFQTQASHDHCQTGRDFTRSTSTQCNPFKFFSLNLLKRFDSSF